MIYLPKPGVTRTRRFFCHSTVSTNLSIELRMRNAKASFGNKQTGQFTRDRQPTVTDNTSSSYACLGCLFVGLLGPCIGSFDGGRVPLLRRPVLCGPRHPLRCIRRLPHTSPPPPSATVQPSPHLSFTAPGCCFSRPRPQICFVTRCPCRRHLSHPLPPGCRR